MRKWESFITSYHHLPKPTENQQNTEINTIQYNEINRLLHFLTNRQIQENKVPDA